MDNIIVKPVRNLGFCMTNSYIVSLGGDAVLIDAPDEPERLLDLASGLKIRALLLTHGHIDHILAVNEIKKRTGCPVYISRADSGMLKSSRDSLADYLGLPFEPVTDAAVFSDNEVIAAGELTVRTIPSPGHTPGSACFLIGKSLFTGDTLFKGSIGRDFGWSGYYRIFDSIRSLYSLGGEYTVYPGHGEATTLSDELRSNPFLFGLYDSGRGE